LSAYRVEVQRGRKVWALADVVRAKDEVRAMRQVLLEAKDITAIRARREYPGLLAKGE